MLLDCYDSASALSSLSHAIGAEPDQLTTAIQRYDSARLEDHPHEDIALSALRALGTEMSKVRFDDACFFHGTRVPDPSCFTTSGLLPLPSVVDEAWAFLGDLVGLPTHVWARFRKELETRGGGDFGDHYRRKLAQRREQGPFGLLLREIHCKEHSGYTTYLRCPEIITDIAESFDPSQELERKYVAATRPCIVKFRTRTAPATSMIETAFSYLHYALKRQPPPGTLSDSFSGEGRAIRATDVLGVEVLDAAMAQ